MGTAEGARGTEGVLEKLDVVNSSLPDLREQGEGRRDFLARLAPAIREGPEHGDLVALLHDLADLECLGLPHPPDPLEGTHDRFRPLVRAGPGQVMLELRVILAQ